MGLLTLPLTLLVNAARTPFALARLVDSLDRLAAAADRLPDVPVDEVLDRVDALGATLDRLASAEESLARLATLDETLVELAGAREALVELAGARAEITRLADVA